MDSPNSIEQRQQTIENLDEEQYLQQSTIDDTVNDDITVKPRHDSQDQTQRLLRQTQTPAMDQQNGDIAFRMCSRAH